MNHIDRICISETTLSIRRGFVGYIKETVVKSFEYSVGFQSNYNS